MGGQAEQGEQELQERTCRACQQVYRYPALKSLATRFYCAECMALSPSVRATFEKHNRRIRQLAAELEKLKGHVGLTA